MNADFYVGHSVVCNEPELNQRFFSYFAQGIGNNQFVVCALSMALPFTKIVTLFQAATKAYNK